ELPYRSWNSLIASGIPLSHLEFPYRIWNSLINTRILLSLLICSTRYQFRLTNIQYISAFLLSQFGSPTLQTQCNAAFPKNGPKPLISSSSLSVGIPEILFFKVPLTTLINLT